MTLVAWLESAIIDTDITGRDSPLVSVLVGLARYYHRGTALNCLERQSVSDALLKL